MISADRTISAATFVPIGYLHVDIDTCLVRAAFLSVLSRHGGGGACVGSLDDNDSSKNLRRKKIKRDSISQISGKKNDCLHFCRTSQQLPNYLTQTFYLKNKSSALFFDHRDRMKCSFSIVFHRDLV